MAASLPTPLRCATNKAQTLISVVGPSFFRIYEAFTLKRQFHKYEDGVRIFELGDSKAYTALAFPLAGSGSDDNDAAVAPLANRCRVYNASARTNVDEHDFGAILALRVGRVGDVDCVAVCTEVCVHVLPLSGAHKPLTVATAANRGGCFDFASGVVVVPSARGPGFVAVIRLDLDGGRGGTGESAERLEFSAHDHALALLRLSADGALLATASDDGKIVRVFALEPGAAVQRLQCRVGHGESVPPYSLSFDPLGALLAVTSARGGGSVAIFALRDLNAEPEAEPVTSEAATPKAEVAPVSRFALPSLPALTSSLTSSLSSLWSVVPKKLYDAFDAVAPVLTLSIESPEFAPLAGAELVVAITSASLTVVSAKGFAVVWRLDRAAGALAATPLLRRVIGDENEQSDAEPSVLSGYS